MPRNSKKSTRKFEKNHLKDTIDRRKDFAKVKQRIQVKDKKRAKRAREDDASNANCTTAEDKPTGRLEAEGDAYEDMTVDDFFQGGFEIPEKPKNKAAKAEQASKKSGKRKRADLDDDEGGDISSASSLEQQAVPSDSDSDLEALDDADVHREELEALQAKDPEFYKHLKDSDPDLLEFGDLAEVDDLSASDGEKPTQKQSKQDRVSQGSIQDEEVGDAHDTDVTLDMVKKWTKAMTEMHSLRAMRQVVLAFRSAVHVDEDRKEYKYSILSPEIYHELLVLTLKHVPDVLNHHLPVKESGSGKLRVATDSKKFRTLTPLLKSHSSSINHLLSTLSDAPTLNLAISSIQPLLPYLLSFKKILKNLVQTTVSVWSDSSNTEATRINAFLVVRKLAAIGDGGIRESVLKNVYQGLVKGSRNTTIHTIQGINLMKNSAAELWGIDQSVGYTTGFTFIRQLAIHLRGSITNTSKESYKTVYNWQYVHSLDFWSRVLSIHCDAFKEAEAGKESSLRPLIYPAVQITLGALRLIPTAQYFPLRFQLIRALLRLSRAPGTYIPVAPALLEVLSSAEMKKPPKASTLKALDFSTAIRAPKAYLRTRVYQEGVGEQVGELLADFFALWSKAIAFPELALPVLVMLKRWLKDAGQRTTGNRNGKINAGLALLVQKLEANARWIEERRARVDFAPNDRAGVDGFLADVAWEKSPLGAFVVGQRKQREEKARLVEEGRRQDEKRRKRSGGSDEEMQDGIDEDDDDEDDEDEN